MTTIEYGASLSQAEDHASARLPPRPDEPGDDFYATDPSLRPLSWLRPWGAVYEFPLVTGVSS
jgi:hypothetical protein